MVSKTLSKISPTCPHEEMAAPCTPCAASTPAPLSAFMSSIRTLGLSTWSAIRSGESSPAGGSGSRHRIDTSDGIVAAADINGFRGFEHTLCKTDMLIDPSLYWKQLSEYRRYFPDEQIRIGFFEEFIADESAELRACLSFLGVDPFIDIDIEDDQDRNPSEGKRQRLVAVDAIRALPGYERVKRFIPQSLKTLFTDRITRPIPMTSPWTAESLQWTVSRIADDSAALLRYAGRSEDYWVLR